MRSDFNCSDLTAHSSIIDTASYVAIMGTSWTPSEHLKMCYNSWTIILTKVLFRRQRFTLRVA